MKRRLMCALSCAMICAALITPTLAAAVHEGKAAGGRTGGVLDHFGGVVVGIVLFLLTESAVLYGTFRTWFRNPNHPTQPSPERYFHGAVFSFVAMVFTGGILTVFFSGVDLSNTPLTAFYGYNNVCIVFDNPPSTYICPVYWFFVAYLIGRYAVEDTKRLMRLTTVGGGLKSLFYALNVVLVLSVAFFFVTLSIDPAADVYGHTAPFMFLVITLPSVSVMHYFQREQRPASLSAGVAVYAGLSLVKIGFDVYALSSGHHVPPVVAQTVDIAWLICALSAPFAMPAPVVQERLAVAV